MKIVIYCMGTMGDIVPFVKLGALLKNLGHDVTCLTNEVGEAIVKSVGLEFVQLTSRDLYEKTHGNRDTWTPEGLRQHFNEYHVPPIIPAFTYVDELVRQGLSPFIISPSATNGARMAADKYDLRHVTVVLAPSSMRSVESPSFPLSHVIDEVYWAEKMPLIYDKIKREFIENSVQPLINPIRERLGLSEWTQDNLPDEHASAHLIALFPEWFRKAPSDWPQNMFFAGFPFEKNLHTKNVLLIESFIKGNGKPIVFTFGSAVVTEDADVENAKAICKKLGRPGLFVSATLRNYIKHVEEGFLCVDFVNFTEILPKCAVLVHHGGIGTCAAALASGIPQLIRPMTFDQPDNGFCIYKLNAGNAVSCSSTDETAAAIEELLASPLVTKSLESVKAKMSDVDGLLNCANHIHELLCVQRQVVG